MANTCRVIIPYYRHEFTFITGETPDSVRITEVIAESREDESEFELDPDDQDYQDYLMSLNVLNWKEQDHYRILGLSKVRFRASVELIRKAYVQKARRYHPDKKSNQQPDEPELDENSDSFKCVMKSYEQLSDPAKRQAFDSVDPMFDNEVPSSCDSGKFFETFGPVFERNAHFSVNQPVPPLGDANSTHEQVDRFYDFWNDFVSWREFSYLDEEDTERAENRFERRQIEQSNKKARKERKKDETVRVRRLVDLAYANDPRVIRFREEERQKRAAEKQARVEAKRQKEAELEEVRRSAEAALKAERDRVEAERHEVEAEQRKQREALKKTVKKERRLFRDLSKAADSFHIRDESDSLADATSRVKRLEQVDQFAESASLELLKQFNEAFVAQFGQPGHHETHVEQLARKCAFFDDYFKLYQASLEEERSKQMDASRAKSKDAEKLKRAKEEQEQWSFEQVQSLIKACSLYPVGSKNRWELVADYVNAHARSKSGVQVTPQAALIKAREALNNEKYVRALADQHRLAQLESDLRQRNMLGSTDISERFDMSGANSQQQQPAAESQPKNGVATATASASASASTWTADEQKRLEEALRKLPGKDDAKWVAVAEYVGSRSKEECVKRYKQLCEMVKAKKAAATKT